MPTARRIPRCLPILKAPKDRRNFPCRGPKTLALGPQFRIQQAIVPGRGQNLLHQGPVLRKTGVMRMGRRGPMSDQTFPGGGVRPQDPAVFEPTQIPVTGVFT